MHKYFQLFFDLLNMISGRNEEKKHQIKGFCWLFALELGEAL
jgi:hypothetical protein